MMYIRYLKACCNTYQQSKLEQVKKLVQHTYTRAIHIRNLGFTKNSVDDK